MRQRSVVFSPEAGHDLVNLYERIASKAGERVAIGYLERIESFCLGFELASERGHRRDDIRAGVRIIGFERRITVAFMVDDDRVTILRLFSKGQDWKEALL